MPNPVGRPRALEPDPKTLRKVKACASIFCTTKEAAAVLGVSEHTFIDFLKIPEVKEAWEAGFGNSRQSLRRKQMKLADQNASMAIFLGKNYLGQTDKQEISGPDGGALQISVIKRRIVDPGTGGA